MKNIKHLVLAFALLPVAAEVSAEQVYEKVNKDGVIEFSDQPSSGSEQIEVKPNVVDVRSAPAGSLPVSPATRAYEGRPGSTQEYNVEINNHRYGYEDERRRREMRLERNAERLPEARRPDESRPANEAVRGEEMRGIEQPGRLR